MSDQVSRLTQLTRMVLDKELARLSEAVVLVDAKAEEIRALRDELRPREATIAAAGDLAFQTGQDALYQAWVQRRLHQLNDEFAHLAALREHQLAATRTAFGRDAALRSIAERRKGRR